MMNNLLDTEKAYIAGLFDGEGCVTLTKSRNHHQPRILISNSDIRVIEWLQTKLPFGRYKAINSKNIRNSHTVWVWALGSKDNVKLFLILIRPYLIIKADQADLLLSLLDAEQETIREPITKKGPGRSFLPVDVVKRREETFNELRRLKTANYQSIQ